tara:strand:+ start:152 stop:667 length:516 start_codon:yes stop_codon:yes gene_type:complete
MRKYYFINKFDTNNIIKQDRQTVVIYRNYSPGFHDEALILKIKKFCKKKSIKFYLSNNIKLAVKLGLDGAYIPAFNNSLKHLAYSFKKNFKIVGSAHNLKEIRIKENQNVEKIFLSSVFKKNKNYLGINRLKLLSNLTKIDVVVLGGISQQNIKKLNLIEQTEFAGISYFE